MKAPSSLGSKIFTWPMLVTLLLGISSGTPYLLSGGTLKAWMRDDGLDLSTIGYFSLVGLPYSLKFLFAPLLDRFQLPWVGRRKGWIVVFQLGLAALFLMMAQLSPQSNLPLFAAFAVMIALFSAAQDIVIDAYRRETLTDDQLGLGSSLAVNGYRIGLLIAGAAAFEMASNVSWSRVYEVMGFVMMACVPVALFGPSPLKHVLPPGTLREAVVSPVKEYFARHGAWLILAFILFYKLGDQLAAELLNPFYLDMGFEKSVIGRVAKLVGFWASIGGGLLGGLILLRLGIRRSLWYFGFLQAISTLGFSVLAVMGPSVFSLALVVGFENITQGMGTAAYVAFMASLCNEKFTATQYALMTSLMAIPGKVLGSLSGLLVEWLGWPIYFLVCTLLAIPGMLLLMRVLKLAPSSQEAAVP